MLYPKENIYVKYYALAGTLTCIYYHKLRLFVNCPLNMVLWMLSLDYKPINFIFFEKPLLLHLMLRKVNKALMKNNYRSSQKNLRDGELNPDLARDKRPFWPLNYHGRNKALTMGVEPIIFWLEVRRVAITPRELLFVEGFTTLL